MYRICGWYKDSLKDWMRNGKIYNIITRYSFYIINTTERKQDPVNRLLAARLNHKKSPDDNYCASKYSPIFQGNHFDEKV
jgi:hypothetical protein